jgi:hypothetical protein
MVRKNNRVWVGLVLALLACDGKKGSGGESTTPIARHDRSRCNTQGKRVVTLDLNRDGQPDVWQLFESKSEGGTKVDVLTCKEVDLNFDGRKDLWNYYDDQGNLRMEEFDLDFDGRIDLVTFLSGGQVVRQEMDTDYDGKPDIWKHYEGGVLVRVERDSNRDGRVDYREFYEGGQLDRINYDRDGDGRLESWDRVKGENAPTDTTETTAKKTARDQSRRKGNK